MTDKNNYTILKNEKSNQKLFLEVEMSSQLIEEYRDKAIKNIGKEIELKGFRKGMAPANLVASHVGEFKVFEEMSFLAINDTLPKIIVAEKINALTQPQISVTKMASGNPVVFKAEFILMPEIKLADYKKIAKGIEKTKKVEVEEKEINDYVDYVRKSKAQAEKMKAGEKSDANSEEELPEFNDDFVKSLGNFKNTDDFKKQLKQNMTAEKQRHESEKRRIQIVEKIIEESQIELPDILVEEELERMLEQFRSDIRNYKMEPADYLKEIKKTEDDLKKEWRADAIKRAKMNLIIPQIADKEKINADQEKVEHETNHLVEHHKVDKERARQYVNFVLRNEAVLHFLENL